MIPSPLKEKIVFHIYLTASSKCILRNVIYLRYDILIKTHRIYQKSDNICGSSFMSNDILMRESKFKFITS